MAASITINVKISKQDRRRIAKLLHKKEQECMPGGIHNWNDLTESYKSFYEILVDTVVEEFNK